MLTAIESVLVFRPRLVGNLHTSPSLVRILKEVHIGTFVEAVVGRVIVWRSVEVVDIPVAS